MRAATDGGVNILCVVLARQNPKRKSPPGCVAARDGGVNILCVVLARQNHKRKSPPGCVAAMDGGVNIFYGVLAPPKPQAQESAWMRTLKQE